MILGTAAKPEVLAELPRERVMAALDGVDGEVVVEGWTEGDRRARSSTGCASFAIWSASSW